MWDHLLPSNFHGVPTSTLYVGSHPWDQRYSLLKLAPRMRKAALSHERVNTTSPLGVVQVVENIEYLAKRKMNLPDRVISTESIVVVAMKMENPALQLVDRES